ncbi:MAG: TonB-dependent receptor [Bacteroidetes bacterium]|nr:TonB-dependent receptor [Bacteroidota bacterium]MCL6101042.1 TonB-dependent receptor [Bacteroidota bacterium]
MKHCLLFLLSFLALSVKAHNAGNICGTVSDAKNEIPLIGVNIQVKNTLLGTTTDLNGKFYLKNIQIGTYEIVFSSLGYQTVIKNVDVKENTTDTLTVKLEESVIGLNEVTVQGVRPISAASSKEIRAIDMQLKHFHSSQDMLLMVPGLFIAQHQGGGKAEQIFLRGFDCDHGTDVSVNVDGMPVNMPTHAHGQGYADLHFLISETVDEMEVNKGPYLANIGDFYTAGAVNFKTKDILENNLIKIEAGQFNTQKYTLMFQPDNGGIEQNGYIAMQYHHSDGPFESPEKFERMNIFGKYFFQLTPNSKLTLSAGGFSTGWNASGQIPDRAVKQGLIDRFGGIDNLEGGVTNRKNVNVNYKFLSSSGSEFEVNSYFTQYNFKLYSNFTYFLLDTFNGDMIEQNEHRTIQGVNANYKFATSWFGFRQLNKIGGGYRGDLIDIQLWHAPNRVRMNDFTNDIVDEQNLNCWYQQEFVFSSKFRMVWGLRHDYFTFSKDDKAGSSLDTINNGLPHATGISFQSVFSPKVNFIISPMKNFDIFLNFGQGFHSNDARDAVIGSRVSELSNTWKSEGLNNSQIDTRLSKYNFDPAMRNTGTLPKATAGEIGIKSRLINKLHLSLSTWYLYLDKEFVYSGDGGVAELSDPTQRLGIDAEARLSILSWLWADVDISTAKATIKNLPSGQNYVPLAPTLTASGGLSVIREQGFSGSIRFRHLSDRPANEDNSVVALGHTLYNICLAYNYKQFTFAINGENILNSEWNEAQFATETRLKGESKSVTELCYTPGNPRNFQFSVSYKF